MMQPQLRERIEDYVRSTMTTVVQPTLALAHDFQHVARVRHWALQIAKCEGYADRDVVEATALLHDIGLATVTDRRQHAAVGADQATQYLLQLHYFTPHQITTIAEAIRAHSGLSGGGVLGAILRDADMLDLFGAIGIMRACVAQSGQPEYDPLQVKGVTWGMSADGFTARFQAGEGMGSTIVDHLNFHISCADNLHTVAARQFAQPLLAYMRAYVLQLEHEILTGKDRNADMPMT
jgi:putative nucleotidyltransferase with HDIG domain